MAVTVDDVAVSLGRTPPADGSIDALRWAMWIKDALFLIEARRKAMAPSSTLDQEVVDYVVREAVAAHVRRPDDATTVNVATDDSSVQRTYQSSSGRVAIIDEWWQLLGLSREGKAFTVSLVDVGRGCHLPWCNLMFGASWCSCGVDIARRPIYEGADGDL